MDTDKIGLVLAKTSELRFKIVNCILEASSNVEKQGKERDSEISKASPDSENRIDDDDDGEEAEAESLLNIKDAFESLENQLSSLQALQQQQWYENEAALAEIEYSQKKLLIELKEYRGKELEVIHEAISFAASGTEDRNDLLLPPYHSWPSQTRKFGQNGVRTGGSLTQSGPKSPFEGIKAFIGAAAKAAVTIVGVITILSLAGFEPRLKKHENEFKLLGLFQLQSKDQKESSVECPPGKVLVMENGEVRCVVKERIEVPFESIVATPNVSYGCG